jgi:hypothetical protein
VVRKCLLCTSGAEGLDKFVCAGVWIAYRQEGRLYVGDSKVGTSSAGWATTHSFSFCTYLLKWLIICVQIQRRGVQSGERGSGRQLFQWGPTANELAFLQHITTGQNISQELNSNIRLYLWSTWGCNNVYAGRQCSLLPILELRTWKNVLSRRNFLMRIRGHVERAYICSGYRLRFRLQWREQVQAALCVLDN